MVNSAAHGPRAPVLEISDEDWHLGMEIYLLNAIRVARLVTPVMQAQKSGSIVNISTYAAFEPEALFPTSGVFRAGLASFTKLFADQYARRQYPHEQRAAGLHRQPAGEPANAASASRWAATAASRRCRN